ncbi:MAG: hypothetical protein ER33_10590 [Cyanobium sp. CACIAM 14]|nr:MAG: hypothetical protein ER33_10590 [Cyanobium sp. CACIAM 14]
MNAPVRAAAVPTTGFLEESPGNRSAMRLMCMVSLLAAIAFGGLTMLRSAPMVSRDSSGQETMTYPPRDDTGMTLTFVFLVGAFAPKVLQKFAEQRLGELKSSDLRDLVLGTRLGQPAEAVAQAPPPAPAAASEDPRLQALREEVQRLRAEMERSRTPIQVTTAVPVTPPAPAPAPALTPLERIRLGGSL